MASGSVIIKQKSHWKEWWYDKLVPGVNVVETSRYFHDLKQIMDRLQQNDEEAETIAKNAFHTFAQV